MQYDEFKRIFNEKSTELGCKPVSENDLKELFNIMDKTAARLFHNYQDWEFSPDSFRKKADGNLGFAMRHISR